jgi:3-deoxy-7-phosphoheptulonate synthase
MSVGVGSPRQIEQVLEVADALVVASHSMQDFSLLRELGRVDRPVVIKRAIGATVEEFLLAAEYVLAGGNGRVILCESGVRSFDAAWKIRFEINAIPLLKRATHLPVLADPSASATDTALIGPVARAALAAGADGLVIDVAPRAGSGRGRALGPMAFQGLMEELRPVAAAVGRRIGAAR